MATNTTKHSLVKPLITEAVDITVINGNMDKLDALLGFAPEATDERSGYHNSIYRGHNLGTSVTNAQWTQIANGHFNDLFIGDYWVINNVNWRIAGFDYWYYHGNPRCTEHHIVIVPDTPLANNVKLHSSSSSPVSYVGSDFYTGANSNTAKATCRSAAQNAFGSEHILTHREYLCNSCTDGYEQAAAWYDSNVELMTSQMVCGSQMYRNAKKPVDAVAISTINAGQLPLFALCRYFDYSNAYRYWLRDYAYLGRYSVVDSYGSISTRGADDTSVAIRPVFGITA